MEKTALEKFNEFGGYDISCPLEKFRFYCSIAMNGCNGRDWMDSELFFEQLQLEMDKAQLYEKLRRMNPREFTELYKKNIETGVVFDELLDKWPENDN